MVNSDMDRNFSKKRGGVRYVRRSQKRKMLRARDAKFPRKVAHLIKLFRNKYLISLSRPTDSSSFLRTFCRQYIFTKIFCADMIPAPFCPHFLLDVSSIWDILHDKPIFNKIHENLYYGPNYENKKALKYYTSNHPDAINLSVKQSQILPFIFGKPDFAHKDLQSQSKIVSLINIKFSESEVELKEGKECESSLEKVRLWAVMSIFEQYYGVLVLIGQKSTLDRGKYMYHYEGVTQVNDFLLQKRDLITEKYFRNVLLKYFLQSLASAMNILIFLKKKNGSKIKSENGIL